MVSKFPLLAPSLLSANFANISQDITMLNTLHIQYLHLDIMDGHFVPNISFGKDMVRTIRPLFLGHLDAHLMCRYPESFIPKFVEAGCNSITVHFEAVTHVHRLISMIKELNVKAGLAVLPSTPLDALKEVLPIIDILLIMTVNPGFSGQKLLLSVLPKIGQAAIIKKEKNFHFVLMVDGGVSSHNILQLIDLGAEILVSGSEFFSKPQLLHSMIMEYTKKK